MTTSSEGSEKGLRGSIAVDRQKGLRGSIAAMLGDLSTFLLGRTRAERAARAWKNTLWLVIIVGGLTLAFYSIRQPSSMSVFAGGFFLAAASALVGGLGGLIFGLPRSPSENVALPTTPAQPAPAQPAARTDTSRVLPNANLVEISDWLTKIIVGLGLTQLGSLPGEFQRLVNYTHGALGSSPYAEELATALILTYAVVGFMLTYLFTRMDLKVGFEAADTTPNALCDKLVMLSELHAQRVLTDAEYDGLKQKAIEQLAV